MARLFFYHGASRCDEREWILIITCNTHAVLSQNPPTPCQLDDPFAIGGVVRGPVQDGARQVVRRVVVLGIQGVVQRR